MKILISICDGGDSCSITYSDKTKPATIIEVFGTPPVNDEVLYEALDKIQKEIKEK